MNQKEAYVFVSDEILASKIYLVRGKKVMIDRDLAEYEKDLRSHSPCAFRACKSGYAS